MSLRRLFFSVGCLSWFPWERKKLHFNCALTSVIVLCRLEVCLSRMFINAFFACRSFLIANIKHALSKLNVVLRGLFKATPHELSINNVTITLKQTAIKIAIQLTKFLHLKPYSLGSVINGQQIHVQPGLSVSE